MEMRRGTWSDISLTREEQEVSGNVRV